MGSLVQGGCGRPGRMGLCAWRHAAAAAGRNAIALPSRTAWSPGALLRSFPMMHMLPAGRKRVDQHRASWAETSAKCKPASPWQVLAWSLFGGGGGALLRRRNLRLVMIGARRPHAKRSTTRTEWIVRPWAQVHIQLVVHSIQAPVGRCAWSSAAKGRAMLGKTCHFHGDRALPAPLVAGSSASDQAARGFRSSCLAQGICASARRLHYSVRSGACAGQGDADAARRSYSVGAECDSWFMVYTARPK